MNSIFLTCLLFKNCGFLMLIFFCWDLAIGNVSLSIQNQLDFLSNILSPAFLKKAVQSLFNYKDMYFNRQLFLKGSMWAEKESYKNNKLRESIWIFFDIHLYNPTKRKVHVYDRFGINYISKKISPWINQLHQLPLNDGIL